MKLTILGGGGFRVPLIHDAVVTNALAAAGRPSISIDEIALHDSSPERLRSIVQILEERTAQLPDPSGAPHITATTDVREALRGADFVFSAIRVGGSAGRALDERVALGLGLLGQETIGPGGLAYALRTIPVMHDVARTIAEVAPNAWTINFTNPAGIVTQAMRGVLGNKVVGICDTPIGLVRRVSRLLGVSLENDQDRVEYDYVGLNHMGWLRSVRIDGVERLPAVLADDAALEHIEEARLIGKDWVRAIKALPNEYLYYYWHTDEAIANILSAGQTRGEFLADEQRRFEESLACCTSPLQAWREALHERESTYMAEARDEERREEDIAGGGYQEVALRLMTALATGSPERMILDVGNDSGGGLVVPELPADLVLEVGCLVDDKGIHPLPVAPLNLSQLGMMARLRASEAAISEAALTGSAEKAWEGFAIHPLVDSPRLGKELLAGYRKAHPSIETLFNR
ncbi:family 4 glycosyl hydrolase [Tessaracoccus antarcticus]|uniref:6-phospho-beta-glucosidase n=1 Tax=Tessaracoccus antarcticus TaxID=2479848 RepID=A0A3M0FZM6_9ACTN|nr:6-phospho-beta-glucosidase [Tessaracoccus antarcticus]RMB58181.1 6-phospho-beta-glucosidase [Tessaracoccus antarcticus]